MRLFFVAVFVLFLFLIWCPLILLDLATTSGSKSAPLRLHFRCDVCGIDTMILSHILLAANSGPPFLPMLVGSACHDEELRVKVNTKAVTVLSASLCWPGGRRLAALHQPGEQRSLYPSVCRAAPHEFLHSWWQAVYRRFFDQTRRDFWSWRSLPTNKPLTGCKNTPQLWWFLVSN